MDQKYVSVSQHLCAILYMIYPLRFLALTVLFHCAFAANWPPAGEVALQFGSFSALLPPEPCGLSNGRGRLAVFHLRVL